MTECERIIENGILPKSFFAEEIICDFRVDEKRKKVWAICIDLLLELDRVCRKYGLEYYLMYGSLLGAMRHDGYIPWDDDVDVVMFRNDYDKLLSLAGEFKNPYFLQTPSTDDGYFYSFAKIRNVNTTYIQAPFMYRDICFGIQIDIFPLDNWIENCASERYEKIKSKILDLSTWMRKNNPFIIKTQKERIASWSGIDPNEQYDSMQELMTCYNDQKTEYVSSTACVIYPWEKSTWKKEWFEPCRKINLYGHLFSIPNEPEKFLEVIYNRWREFPPIEERGSWHDSSMLNPDISYLEVIDNYRRIGM